MRYKNIEFHNIYEIIEEKNYTRLYRFPANLISGLESSGEVREVLHGCEIRFVLEGEAEIELISLSGNNSSVVIYYGDYQDQPYTVSTSGTKIKLSLPFNVDWLDTINKTKHRFNPRLVRIVLYEKIAFVNLTGTYSYPTENDYPKLKMLSYGTSITQGRRSFYPDINYPQIFAERVGYDLDNLAMSGSCFIEPSYVDFLLDRKYDLITLCLSTNMLGKGYLPEVFAERVEYLFKKIKETNPDAIVFAISILTSYRDLELIKTDVTNTNNRHIYRNILKDLSEEYDFNYIGGDSLLKHYHLTYDLLHPGHYGMIEIAENLIRLYNEQIKKAK